MTIKIIQTIIRIVMFALSFITLSGINFDKLMLKGEYKVVKTMGLLILLSLGLGYLSSEFLIVLLTTFAK